MSDSDVLRPSPAGGRNWLPIALVIGMTPLPAAIMTVPPPLLPAFARALGGGAHGTLLAQLFAASSSAALALGPPLGGWLIDRHGLRTVIPVSLFLYLVSGLVPLFNDDFAVLVASRFLLGLAGAGLLSAGLALLLSWFEGRSRDRMLGYPTP